MNDKNGLVGNRVTAVWLSEGGGAIRFDLDGVESIVARCDGDCCSHTWIEAVQGVEQLVGAVVVSVEDVGIDTPNAEDSDEVIAYYGCKITTDRGYALIDYRNASNGYYGGSLSWPGDVYFYGGVFGQNGSTEGWQQVTS